MVRIFITMADSGDFTDLFAYINHGLVNIFHSGMYSLGGEGGCSKEYVLYARENVENYGPPLI